MNWFKRQKEAQSKVIHIMRGLPGSGKSTKANNLAGNNGLILSTDDFFMADGKYMFDPAMLGQAHLWNEMRAQEAIKNSVSPIIIDNNNAEAWEAKKYVQMATEAGYDIKIEEPDTPWAFDSKELTEKNTHGVSQEDMDEKLKRWQPDLTVNDILSSERPKQGSAKIEKSASVTFSPSGGEKVAQPKNMSNIGYDLVYFSHQSGKLPEGARLYTDDIAPDGQSWSEDTGVLNFYLMTKKFNNGEWEPLDAASRIRPSQVVEIIDMWNEVNPGIQMKITTVDESNARGVPTVRIEVLSNDTTGIEEIPQLHVSNANASQLLNMLSAFGIEVSPDEGAGAFSADSYRHVRRLIEPQDVKNFTRPEDTDNMNIFFQELGADESQEELGPYEQMEKEKEHELPQYQGEGPAVHSFGLGEDRIGAYLSSLDDMVSWLDKNGVPDRMIIFG